MSRGPDAGVLLERRLRQSALVAGCAVTILKADWERWASATFTGARHQVTLSSSAGAALDAWLAGLSEVDLPLNGHLVADVVVRSVERAGETAVVTMEALTVEER